MENQTGNGTNFNIGVSEVKPKRKKSKVLIIITVLVILLVSCGVLLSGDDSSTSTPTTTEDQVKEPTENQISIDAEATPAEKEEEEKPITEAEPEEEEEATVNTPDSSAGLGRGSLIQYDKANVVVIDAGIMINEIEDTILYVNMEVENTSDEVLYFGRSNFYLYIDDYQVDTYSANRASDDFSLHDIEINSGRKSKYTYTAYIPNDYASAQKIEVEFPGKQILYIVKDGKYLWNQEAVPAEDYEYGDPGNTGAGGLDESMYGDHQSLDGLSYVLNFGPIDNGNGADALTTIKDGSNNYQWVMYMEDERTGYLYHMEEYVEVGTIYFSMDGIEVESSEHPEFNGLYW